MKLDALLYLAPLLVGGTISLLLLASLFSRRRSPMIQMFMAFLGVVCLWIFGYALELVAGDLRGMLLWRKIRYIGVVFVPVLWFCFAMRYSDREECTRPGSLLLLSAIPAVALVLLWTSGLHELFYTEVTAVPVGPFQVIGATGGPFFWLQAAYGYLLVVAGIGFILRSAASAAGIYARQSLTVVAGIVVPMAGNLLLLLNVNPVSPYDITPALFPIGMVAIWWSVTRFHFLDLAPVARKSLFDSLDIAIFVVDDRDRIVHGNPAAISFLRTIGVPSSVDEVIGEHVDDVFAGYPELAELCQAREKTHASLELPTDDGSRWYDVTLTPMPRGGRGRAGRLVTLRDVTARREVAETLRHRVELQELISRLSATFVNLPSDDIDDGIRDALQKIGQFVGADRSYVFQLRNSGAVMDNTHEWCAEGVEPQRDRLQGLPTDRFPWWMERLRRFESIHIPRIADMPPEAREEQEILEAQDIQSLVVVPLVYKHSLAGFIGFDAVHEEKRWRDETINLLRLAGDIIVSALQRKQGEAERAYQRQYFQSLFDDSPEAIVSLDAQHRAEAVNPAFQSLFGYDEEDIRGETPDDFILPPEHEEEGKEITRRVMDGEVVTIETVRMNEDGERIPVSLLAAPIFIDGRQVGIFGIYRDISDRKEAEDRVTELIDLLHLLNKIMRHDILNHMQIAQSALELYRESMDEELLEKTGDRVQQVVRLIKRMRGLESMVATGKDLEPVDVRATAEEVTADCGIPCTIRGEARVMADEALHSVLRNLVDNAVKHGDASEITIDLSCGDDTCEVRVADDGTGVPDEIKQRVFDEGFSHGGSRGSGLGLYIVKKTIERYGGSIRVEDNEPQGTVFVMWLPAGGQP